MTAEGAAILRFDRTLLRQDAFEIAIDWQLDEGASIALVGPSGAGKSTVLSAIAGFLAPVEGRILWCGNDLADVRPAERPVTILFQDHNLFPHLTITQNLGLGLDPRLRLTRDQSIQIEEVLERVDLSGLGERVPSELSGGQQGRVALARALLRARPILLLDEPFAALGPRLKAEMLELVREIVTETGATLFLVTHHPEDAKALGGMTSVVANGAAALPVETRALFANPPPELRDYLGS